MRFAQDTPTETICIQFFAFYSPFILARAEKPYFPDIDEKVLADCIATYQQLGCRSPHVEIARAAYEKTLDVFEYNGQLKQCNRYEQVCATPP